MTTHSLTRAPLTITEADFHNAADAEALLALLDEYANDPMGGAEPLSDYARKHLVAELAARPHAHALIARVSGQPAGLAIYFEGFSTFAARPLINLHDFAVSPGFRGQGIGQAMLAKLDEVAIAAGCCKVTLEVLEGNPVAQRLYDRAGFAGYALTPETGKAMFWQKRLPSH